MMAPTSVTIQSTHFHIYFVRHSRVYIEREYEIRRIRRQPSTVRPSSVVWDFLPMLLLFWFVLLVPPSDLSRAAKLDLLLLLPIMTARLARRRALTQFQDRAHIDFDEFRSASIPEESAEMCTATAAASIEWALGVPACVPFYRDEEEERECAPWPIDSSDFGDDFSDDEELSDSSTSSYTIEESSEEGDILEAGELHESSVSELTLDKIDGSESKCGAYWALDASSGARVGVFKPVDEECPAAVGEGFVPMGEESTHRAGVRVGDAWKKEIAAYRLDHDHLAGVPVTRPQAIAGPDSVLQAGSLQDFVPSAGAAEDFGPSSFDVDSVQAIALLDLRLFNLDRHQGNMLAAVDSGEGSSTRALVPIDHGLCLPRFDALGEAYFEWMEWKQTRAPLSQSLRAYIAALDVEHDAAVLRSLDIPEESITTNTLCTEMVKRCVTQGMTLHDIGSLMCRDLVTNSPAPIEKWVASIPKGVSQAEVVRQFCAQVDEFLASRKSV